MKVAGSLLILSRFSPQRESKWEKMKFRFEGLDSSFWSGFIWDLVHGRGQWRHPPSSQQHASAGISPIISKKPPAGIQYLVSLVNRTTCIVVCNCLVVCDLLLWLLNFQNSRHTLLGNIIWGRCSTTPTVNANRLLAILELKIRKWKKELLNEDQHIVYMLLAIS
jgi:hypothetical protein